MVPSSLVFLAFTWFFAVFCFFSCLSVTSGSSWWSSTAIFPSVSLPQCFEAHPCQVTCLITFLLFPQFMILCGLSLCINSLNFCHKPVPVRMTWLSWIQQDTLSSSDNFLPTAVNATPWNAMPCHAMPRHDWWRFPSQAMTHPANIHALRTLLIMFPVPEDGSRSSPSAMFPVADDGHWDSSSCLLLRRSSSCWPLTPVYLQRHELFFFGGGVWFYSKSFPPYLYMFERLGPVLSGRVAVAIVPCSLVFSSLFLDFHVHFGFLGFFRLSVTPGSSQ